LPPITSPAPRSPEAARESAEYRVRASNTVDRITSRRSKDLEDDWRSLEEDLTRCYRVVVMPSG